MNCNNTSPFYNNSILSGYPYSKIDTLQLAGPLLKVRNQSSIIHSEMANNWYWRMDLYPVSCALYNFNKLINNVYAQPH